MPAFECPECHQDIGDLTAEELLAHRNKHWDDEVNAHPIYDEARRRRQALTDEVDRRRDVESRQRLAKRPGGDS